MVTSQPKCKTSRIVSSQKLVITCFLYQAAIPLLKFKSGSNFLIKMKNTKSTEQKTRHIRESKWQFSLSGKLETKYAYPSLTEIFYLCTGQNILLEDLRHFYKDSYVH